MTERREMKRAGSFGCPISAGGRTALQTGILTGTELWHSAEHPDRATRRIFTVDADTFPQPHSRAEGCLAPVPDTAPNTRTGPQADAEQVPRLSLLGREAAGLKAALEPYLARETLTPRALRELADLLLICMEPAPEAAHAARTEPAYVPELDFFGDTAELWLFDRHSEDALRFSWRILPGAKASSDPLPEDELERLVTLRTYLMDLPADPAGEALLSACEARIQKLTHGRVARKRSTVC